MKFSELLANVFELECQKVYEQEKADSNYLPQEQFETCTDRAQAGLNKANRQVAKVAAYCIARHRQSEHGEDHEQELKVLTSTIESEYLTMADAAIEAETDSWWNI